MCEFFEGSDLPIVIFMLVALYLFRAEDDICTDVVHDGDSSS
jgi:hypothetical protein